MDFCAAFSGSFLVPAWVFGNRNVKIIREEAKCKFTLTFLTVVWRKKLHGQNIYFHERVNKLYKENISERTLSSEEERRMENKNFSSFTRLMLKHKRTS
jgi:hypothetical protein